MTIQTSESIAKRYFLFEFFGNLAFFTPVVVLFWQSNGLTMTQIMLLQSIYSILVSLLELPTGAFADHFGKKQSLILGSFFWVVGTLWYGSSHLFWQFVIGEMLCGVGSAFISGADRSYLHQILREEGREKDFTKIESKARGFVQIAQGSASVVGGLIASISLPLTVLLTSIPNMVNIFIARSFPSVTTHEHSEHTYFSRIHESVRLIQKNKKLMWFTLFFVFYFAFVWPMQFYFQAYMSSIGVPVYAFGVIFLGINIIAAYVLNFTHQLQEFAGRRLYLFFIFLFVIPLIVLMLFPSFILLPLGAVFLICVFMMQTAVTSDVLKMVPHHTSATVLSFQNLSRRVVLACIVPFLGMATDRWGLRTGLIGYALIALVVLLIIYLFRPPNDVSPGSTDD
jgi:MFS family permease